MYGLFGRGAIRDLTPEEVAEGLAADKIMLIDVREPNETAHQRIAGALLAPLSQFDPIDLPDPGGRLRLRRSPCWRHQILDGRRIARGDLRPVEHQAKPEAALLSGEAVPRLAGVQSAADLRFDAARENVAWVGVKFMRSWL